MGLMSNPAKLQELMSDPDVGPVLSQLLGKFMGGGGGGSFPGAAANDDVNDDDMDMPDLEEMD